MSREGAGNRSAAGEAGAIPPGLAVQYIDRWSAASPLLSLSTLERLCGKDVPNEARQAQLSVSHVIVATYHGAPMACVAYKPGAAGVRVAHELWVDANAPCGIAPVTGALLGRLEQEVIRSGCSTLFIVVSHTTPVRRILQTQGYTITLEGADLLWFEKAFHPEPDRAA
jgi:hypothetical protein